MDKPALPDPISETQRLSTNDHTPTPWHASSTAHTELVMGFKDGVQCILAELDTDYVEMSESEANAAFIVEAANNHAALVTALHDVLWACHHVEKWHCHIDETFSDDSEWTDSAKFFKEKRAAAREALARLTLRTERAVRT